MTRTIALLLCIGLLLGSSAAAAAEERSAPPWFGGRLETAEFAWVIPDDWLAIDLRGDLETQSAAIAEWLEATSGRCLEGSCSNGLERWLRDQDQTVRLLATDALGGRNGSSPDDPSTCRLHGPASLQGHPSSEYAGIVHDSLARNPDVDISEPPHALPHSDGSAYTFGFDVAAAGLQGAVFLFAGDGRFAWIECRRQVRPGDRWRSVVDTFELVAEPAPGLADTGASDVPELQAMLPVWLASSALCSYSRRGLDYLREWSRIPDDRLGALEEDPAALDGLLPDGVELDDIEFANAGRCAVTDPPWFVTALRVRGVPASMLPLSMVVKDADAGAWTEADFGDRVVRVGTEAMLDQQGRPGRPYVYDVGEVRFVVTTDDEAWAAEAFARLRPEAAVENAPLLVSLPEGWRPGLSPSVDDALRQERYRSGMLAAAHDATRVSQWYVPTVEIHYTRTRLDRDVATTLDRWADEYPEEPWAGRTLYSLERVELPSGDALRLEMMGHAAGASEAIGEIRYLIAAPAGVYDLLFSSASSDLPDYVVTFDAMARSLMATDPGPDSQLARLARGELTRTEYETLAGGYTTVPEREVPRGPGESSGPVVQGGRIEVPERDFGLEIPEAWHAIDMTHPEARVAMERFDETTRSLIEGLLIPENPLKRGAFAVFGALGGLTSGAVEDLAADRPSGLYDLVAVAPWDGIGSQHECVVYGWDAADTPVSDAAADMAQGLRDGGYDAGVVPLRLPAGEAMHIAASDDGLELSIYLLEHEGRHYHLECGHSQRHEATWRGIADSLGFLSVEP